MASLVSFAELLAGRTRAGDSITFTLTDDWQQGRTAFGGVVAAIAACAIRDLLGPERPLRALLVNFIDSVPSGPVQVRVETLRAGGSITQAQATVLVAGQTACVIGAVLGLPKRSALPGFALTRPATTPADALSDAPFIAAQMPAFLRHFSHRWAEGAPPGTGQPIGPSRIWLALRSAPVPRELMAILYADAMPSPALAPARGPAYGASLAWSIEFLSASQGDDGEGWWRADTEIAGSAQGYAHQITTVWAPDGRAAARSQQVAALYA